MHGVRRVLHVVAGTLAEERSRWILWLPVAFGTGIWLYFTLRTEPSAILSSGVVLLLGAVAIAARRHPPARFAAIAGTLVAAGLAVPAWHSVTLDAPTVHARSAPADITGRVTRIESRERGYRMWLENVDHPWWPAGRTPRRVRLTVLARGAAPVPGQTVVVRAVLLPLPAPVVPGGFDFQRRGFFWGLGATGYTLGAPAAYRLEGGTLDGAFVERLRLLIARKIRAALPGSAGAVATALLTGDRGAIPAEDLAAIRDAGLAHLLAISGLHMGMVMGLVFFGIRGLLAAAPRLAARRPIKKWAALAALCGGFCYLLLSGATVPTQRAFFMGGLVLLGVMIDRLSLSMRLVAGAAAVLLLVDPEALMGPSFQMSFAAVVALIAVYEARATRSPGAGPRPPPAIWSRSAPGRIARWFLLVGLTTLIAGTATAPFAVYHFNRVAVFGMIANLVAVPLTALWIMPAGLVSLLLMPFGLEGLALRPMGWGIDAVTGVAHATGDLPGAVALVRSYPDWGMALIVAGGLWMALWRRRWRFLGIVPLLAGLCSWPLAPLPDMLVSPDGRLIAARGSGDRLLVSTMRGERFVRDAWLRGSALEHAVAWPIHGSGDGGRLRCDRLGCILLTTAGAVAVVGDPAALHDDCRRARLVVVPGSDVRAKTPGCRDGPQAPVVLDRTRLHRNGAHTIRFVGRTMRIRTDTEVRGERPWVVRPVRSAARAR